MVLDKTLQEFTDILKDRESQYGNFRENVETIRDLMRIFFGRDYTAREVYCFLIALKLTRMKSNKVIKSDTLMDIAGYSILGTFLTDDEDGLNMENGQMRDGK